MATTTTHRIHITGVPGFPDDESAREALRNGLLEAMIAFTTPEIDRLYDEMPSGFTEPAMAAEWGALEERAVLSVLDQVAAILTEAVRRQLPFEWEGVNLYR